MHLSCTPGQTYPSPLAYISLRFFRLILSFVSLVNLEVTFPDCMSTGKNDPFIYRKMGHQTYIGEP